MNDQKSTSIINEPLQSTIIRVANGNVYLTGKRVFKIKDFITKFYGKTRSKQFKTVEKTRLGFCLIYKSGERER